MKAMLFALITMVSTSSVALEVGERAPFVYVDGLYTGIIDNMSPQFIGKPVYVDFWASWCAPCRISLPWLNDLQTRFKSAGLQVIAINTDEDKADGHDFLKSFQPNYLLGWDGENGAMINAFEPKGMPTSYLIGADGTIKYIHSGFKESDKEEIISAIEQVLAN